VILDSSIVIDHESDPDGLASLLADYDEAAIAAITMSELLVGVLLTSDGAPRERRRARVETFLAGMPVIAFDSVTARVHASVIADLEQRGERIKANDALIAATALAHGRELLTADERDFSRVTGLSLRIFSSKAKRKRGKK
jgi:predicted nucleic acid-binding protein